MRVVEAFGTDSPSKISKRIQKHLPYTQQSVSGWKDRGSLPSIEVVCAIQDETNVVAYWLGTGKGEKFVQLSAQKSVQTAAVPSFKIVAPKELTTKHFKLTATARQLAPSPTGTFMVNVEELRQNSLAEVVCVELGPDFKQDGWPSNTKVFCVPADLDDLRDGDRCIVLWREQYRARIYRTDTENSLCLEHVLGIGPTYFCLVRDVQFFYRIIDPIE